MRTPRTRRLVGALVSLSAAALPVLGASALVTVTSPSASAVISGNVLSGTMSSIWQTNSEVDALAMANGVIYAGGKFTSVRPPGAAAGSQEVARSYLAAFNASTGALITTFNVALNNRVSALSVSPDGTRLYVGGNFTTVNGTTRNRLAAVTTSTGALVTGFNPNPNRGVTSLAATNTTVYLGGDFSTVRATARANIASVTAATGALNTAFATTLVAPPPSGTTVYSPRVDALALAPDGSRVLAGGSFQTVNGVFTGGMASLDPVDGSLEQWSANVDQPVNTNCGGRVTAIITSGDTAYVTGEGDPPGCYEGTYSARISDGRMNWNASCLGASQGLAIANGVLYKGSHQHDCAFMEGGAFGGYVGGISRETFLHRYLVGQDVRDGSFVHWSPNTNATAVGATTSVGPQVMASDGRQVVVGGDFTRVGSSSQAGLARFEPNGDTATPEVPGRNYNGDPWPDTDPIVVSRMPVTVQPTAAGTLTVEFPAVHDPDTGTLTYRVYRDNGTTPIATMRTESWHWSRPVLRFDDTGLAAGSTHSYRVDATDGLRASARSTAVSGTVRTTAAPSFTGTYAGLNPLTWWNLGDSGATAADSSATGTNTGTYQGGVTRGVAGAVSASSAVDLDGSTGYVASDAPFSAPNAFSESVWFKTTTMRGGVLMAQTSAATGPGGTTDRLLAMDNNGAVVFGIGRTAIRNQGPTWNDGEWHLAVGTYDGNGNAALYVDGWLQASSLLTRLPAAAAPSYLRAGYADTTNVQLVFGRNYYSRHWPLSDYFDGSLDEVTAFDTALSAQQVAEMFAAGVAGGGSSTPPQPPTASFTASADQLVAAFDATGSQDADGTLASYGWNFGDGSTGTGATASHTYAAGGTYRVTLTVTDDDGLSDTETRQVTITEPPAEPTDTVVVENGSAWRWRYAAGAPEANWNTTGFDASTWSQGNAVFGWGTPVTTSLDIYPDTTQRPRAAYFTRSFQVADASRVVGLALDTVANDGIVVYVNGTEVARSNMPTGTITFNSYASSARNVATANASPVEVTVPPGLLVDGTNVVSVETHVNFRTTRDVTFDLSATLTEN